jgi:hypothetical protein
MSLLCLFCEQEVWLTEELRLHLCLQSGASIRVAVLILPFLLIVCRCLPEKAGRESCNFLLQILLPVLQ